MASIARAYGVECDTGGKHWRFTKSGCRTYPIPGHNGAKSEVPWKYIQGLCNCMGIPLSAFTD